MGREERAGVLDLRENPSLGDLLNAIARNVRVTLRTATVVSVAPSQKQPLGYDPTTQLCSLLVQQLTTTINPKKATGAGSTITQPPVLLVNVPVAWPRTGAGYLTFPLAIGDTGELIIQDRSLQEWLKKGFPVDPIDNWTHNRGDGVFHPGLHSNRLDKRLPATDQTATVLEGPALAGVKLGRLASSPLVKGTPLVAAFNTYNVTVQAAAVLAALGGVPPPGTPVPPTPVSNAAFIATLAVATATLNTAIAASLSTKVLTE